jgi:5'-nucleotidase
MTVRDGSARRVLYVDMDGTLVDFQSGIDRLPPQDQRRYAGRYDDAPGIFALMDPMPGAIEAYRELDRYFDTYILSTAPWDNPSAWSDKLRWVQAHLATGAGEPAYKRLILSHHKNLLRGDVIIDDRDARGVDRFDGEHVHFRADPRFPDWPAVVDHLLAERSYLLGGDPTCPALVLVPLPAARADALFNRTLYGRTTMGMVRRVPGVLEVLEEWLDDGGDPDQAWTDWFGAPRDALPDDFEIEPSQGFNQEGRYDQLILAAPRTAQLAPREILAEFGRHPDTFPGLDPCPDTWLDPEDLDAISQRMAELGYRIVDDEQLLRAYGG